MEVTGTRVDDREIKEDEKNEADQGNEVSASVLSSLILSTVLYFMSRMPCTITH